MVRSVTVSDRWPRRPLENPEQMATTCVASTLTRCIGRQKSETFALGYETFFLTGEKIPCTDGGDILAGGYFDINNNPILDTTNSGQQFYSDCPDGTSLIQLSKPHGANRPTHGHHRLFAVVQFEYTTRNAARRRDVRPVALTHRGTDGRPGRPYRQALPRELPQRGHFRDQGLVDHVRAPAARRGTRTSRAKNTSRMPPSLATPQLKGFSKNLFGDENTANPYDYGHLPEVTVHRPTAPGPSSNTTVSAASRMNWCR